jgi:hypothetical protein
MSRQECSTLLHNFELEAHGVTANAYEDRLSFARLPYILVSLFMRPSRRRLNT